MNTRTWFRVHSFTGVVTGLMLFVICWSGTFAVVSNEIDWLVTPEARVEVGEQRANWGDLEAAVEATYPHATVSFLSAPLYARSAAQVLLDLPHQNSVWVYVDPYMTKVQGAHSYFNVQRFFRSFHMNLFLPNVAGIPIGLYVVSVFSLTMLTSLIAALVFYKRWWRRFFHRPRGRGRAFWSELHKTGGLWSIWFIVVIGLTSAWYLYEALQPGPVNYVGPPPGGVVDPPAPTSDPALPPLPIDMLIAEAEADWPGFEIRGIATGWYSGATETVYLEGQAGFPLVRNRANQMHLDPRTGEILWRSSAADLPAYWLWSNMADPVFAVHRQTR